MNIETLCKWDGGKVINTRRGVRTLRQAAPTPAFWNAWRNNNSTLRDAGISATKDGGNWVALWWTDGTYIAPVADIIEGAASLVKWSAEQVAIFDFFATGTGNLVVSARAGTGKTTTIKQAFSFVVGDAVEMLYAVFGKKNQVEAQAKISDPRVEISTLHSLGRKFICMVWPNVEPDNSVEGDRIRACYPGELEVEAVSAVEKLVGFGKNLFITVPTVAELVKVCADREIVCGLLNDDSTTKFGPETLATLAVEAMKRALVRDERNRISFNDMVWLPVAANWVRAKFDLVVVDEAQDMNLPQLEMAVRACKPNGRIVVVGDDRQAIYFFRGAASDGMDMMKRRLNAPTLGLTVTYRCPKCVVELAAKMVPDYKAAPEAPEGRIVECDYNDVFSSVQPGDAVLSRSNAPLMGACLSLLKLGIGARIEGREIGVALSKQVEGYKAKSVPDFFRKLKAWSEKQIARRPLAHDEIMDTRATLEAVAEGCANVGEISRRLKSMFADTSDRPCVVLSTVHKAKGLEWDNVFVLEWTFKGKTQEDNNVYYVAITRTKKTLIHVAN